MPPNNDYNLPFTWHLDLNAADLTATNDMVFTADTTNAVEYNPNETVFTNEAKEAIIRIVDERIKELLGAKAYMLGLIPNTMNTGDYDGDE